MRPKSMTKTFPVVSMIKLEGSIPEGHRTKPFSISLMVGASGVGKGKGQEVARLMRIMPCQFDD